MTAKYKQNGKEGQRIISTDVHTRFHVLMVKVTFHALQVMPFHSTIPLPHQKNMFQHNTAVVYK